MSLYSSTLDQAGGAEDFLHSLPLFSELSPKELAEVADHVRRRAFATGVILFHQDMPGITLYMVESGWIRVFSSGRTGQELTLAVFGRGDIFGELSLLDAKNHSATAMTLAPTIVWMLPRADLEDCMQRHPGVARAMMRLLVKRLRSVINHAEAMTFQDVQGRLAYEILDLAERHGRKSGESIELDVPLTQGDLATLVGATRESVNKALIPLRNANLVKIEGNRLFVMNPAGLRRLFFERGR